MLDAAVKTCEIVRCTRRSLEASKRKINPNQSYDEIFGLLDSTVQRCKTSFNARCTGLPFIVKGRK
ncbi:hypothetical protein CCP4SC76_4190005 [Gammaproteobacteria bacterium]